MKQRNKAAQAALLRFRPHFSPIAPYSPPMQPIPIPPAIMQQAQAAADIQDYQEIVHIFARAVRAMPGHFQLRVFHAGALGQCGHYAEARQAFKALLKEVPAQRQAEFRGMIGTIWRNTGRNDFAEPHLRALVESQGSPIGGYEALADVLERLNRVDEAESLARQGLRRFPGHPTLVFMLGRLHRRRLEWDRAEAVLRECLALPATEPALEVEAWYELGHVLEGQGRHREAFAAFQAGKAGPKAAAIDEWRLWRSRLAYMRSGAVGPSAGDFRRWAEPVSDAPMSQSFLVGCPRSGTTLLERVLDAHPGIVAAPETMAWRAQVWMPLLKELRAKGLAPDGVHEVAALDAITGGQIAEAFKKYRAAIDTVMETTVGKRHLVDKNPSYFPLIASIMRMFPGAKLLVALRDPRAVVWSCFTQTLPLNPETVSFLDLATTAEHVAAWLQNWLTLRDRLATPWREVRYESMVTDFAGEARATVEFLGLPWDGRVADFHKSAKQVRSPSYASASRPIYSGSLERWRHYEEFMAPHMDPLRPVMEQLGYAW